MLRDGRNEIANAVRKHRDMDWLFIKIQVNAVLVEAEDHLRKHKLLNPQFEEQIEH